MTRLQYLLSTLHEVRCRPHARLASGWLLAFTGGESNPLGHGKRFQSLHRILLFQAWPGASWGHARRNVLKAEKEAPGQVREFLDLVGVLYEI
ncbi:MAG: hypothetical protein D6692_00220, partial [Planctomycetota bacterium]